MITDNDRHVRECLIRTHDYLSDRRHWCRISYQRQFLTPEPRNCLMGRIGIEMACWDNTNRVLHPSVVYNQVNRWFTLELDGQSPLKFNDCSRHKTVMAFLAVRIADLDAELIKDAPKEPEPEWFEPKGLIRVSRAALVGAATVAVVVLNALIGVVA